MKKIILLLTLLSSLFSGEYIITYKAVAKDALLYHENYAVSKAMVATEMPEYGIDCKLFVEQQYEGSMRHLLAAMQEEVLGCLFKRGVRLRDDTLQSQLMATSQTTISIPPTRVIAEFNNDFVTIGVISATH